MKVRKTPTTSGKTAIQVVEYINNSCKVLKHIGSAKETAEILELVKTGYQYISTISPQQTLPLPQHPHEKDIFSQKYILGNHLHKLLYDELTYVYGQLKFNSINDDLLKDLSIGRIVKPMSTIATVEELGKLFNIDYSIDTVYRHFKNLQRHKYAIEEYAINYAVNELKQNINILFYDVTTLYFETFTADELRQCGFSKDNKFNQPQVVIGLIMTDIGFPVSYHMFNGKKFEGKTIIPSIKQFCEKHKINKMTVVADAAMISKDNINLLIEQEYEYIVGARLGNLKQEYLDKIYSLNKSVDQQTFTIQTSLGRLIIQYSDKRYRKDLYELEKSYKNAENTLKHPAKISSRFKFIRKSSDNKYELNTKLIEKQKKLLGLKGYYTNTNLTEQDVIKHYKNLWKIEKNFRVFKTDMKVRPIFHWRPATVQSHILICFTALCMSKIIELKTNISIHRYVNILMEVTDTAVRSMKTGEDFYIRNTHNNDQINDLINLIHKS